MWTPEWSVTVTESGKYLRKDSLKVQQKLKLGFSNGNIRDNGDGTATYSGSNGVGLGFKVRIADITGFAYSGTDFRVLGHGAELARATSSSGAAGKMEAWFRAHPDFGQNVATAAPQNSPLDGRLVADELIKLAGLRDAGVLTAEEFDRQKVKLLG